MGGGLFGFEDLDFGYTWMDGNMECNCNHVHL